MNIPKFKAGSQHLIRFKQKFYGYKWKYVLREGMLKGGLFMFAMVYGMELMMGYTELTLRNAAFYFFVFLLGEIPLSLFFYRQFAKQIEAEEHGRFQSQ